MGLRDFSDKAMKRFDKQLREANRKPMADSNKGVCPECENEIILDVDDDVDDYIDCNECGTELVIADLDPPAFEIVEEEYDEDEDEDEY